MELKSGNFNLIDKFAFQLEIQTMPFANRRTIIFIFFGLFIMSALVSCQTENCLSTFNNYLLVGFVKTDTLEDGTVAYAEADTMFYSVTAVGNDSVFYDPGDEGSSFVLPVNPAENFTSFRFEILDSIAYDSLDNREIYYVNPTPRVLTVGYRRSERIITEDCGIEISFTQLQINESDFRDSLINNSLSRFNKVNIEVFF
jgi:hypothetical protein